MPVTGLPTNNGLSILTSNLKDQVTKFTLYGTTSSGSDVPYDETSTYSSLSSYQMGEFDIARAYYDENGTLTFECPIPYNFENTKWVGAAGLVYVDTNGAKTLVAISSMPRFQKTSGIGGTIYFKVPILGEAGSPIFGEMSYISADEFSQKLNELHGNIEYTLGLAGLTAREQIATLEQRIQTGTVTIYNRGVISGVTATKSTNAVRNINVSAGLIFINGQRITVFDMPNTAGVPQNTTAETKYSYLYLYLDVNNNTQIDCTNLDELPPADSITLYKITIPANNTEATDPYLANCTLTDLRRIESNYPAYFSTTPQASVALNYPYPDNKYFVDLEIVSYKGILGDVFVTGKQTNGFNIYSNGLADQIVVNYKTFRR